MGTPKIVLTADRTLMSPYRGLSLATFFGCAPALDPNRDPKSFWYKILGKQVTPKVLFDFICNWSPDINGAAKYAPYGLRKLEAGLLRDGFARKDVVVAHPKNVAKDNPRYGDIKVLSAVKTIFGVPIPFTQNIL